MLKNAMPTPIPTPLRRLLSTRLLPLLLSPAPLLLPASAAFAQAAPAARQPPAPLTKLQYVSPLRSYKAYADTPIESWREANDRVGRIGGWRAYAREMQAGEPAQAADPHAGHGAHGAHGAQDSGAKP